MDCNIQIKIINGRVGIVYLNPDQAVENIGLLFDLQDAIRDEIQRVMGVGKELGVPLECAGFDIPISI